MRMEWLFLLWSSFSEARNQLHSYRTSLITPSASVKKGPKVKMKTTHTKEDMSIQVYESRKNGLGKDLIIYMRLALPLFFICFYPPHSPPPLPNQQQERPLHRSLVLLKASSG